MKIILTSETSIRLIPEPGAMTIEAESAEQQYSPFHMLASSLAFCTFSVMYSWATHVKIPVDGLTFDVSWKFAEDPHRVGTMALQFDWPGLPEKRINAAKRAAELCTVHATLMHPPTIEITMATEGTMTDSTDSTDSTDPTDPTDPTDARRTEARADAGVSGSSTAQGLDEKAIARDASAAAGGAADLPPTPVQQGDGQEANTVRPSRTDSSTDSSTDASASPGAAGAGTEAR